LHIDDLDIEYSYICGDSGGGAGVHKLHPELTEIGTMPETGLCLFANCVFIFMHSTYPMNLRARMVWAIKE
jgi:hypothetical protein